MIQARHLRHPLRSAFAARSLAAMHLEMHQVAVAGRRHFCNDPRYDLQNVTAGFAPHPNNGTDDSALLKRIVRAYTAAMEKQNFTPDAFQPTEWWRDIRRSKLEPVLQALSAGDTAALDRMYRSFFRDPCSTGLISVPYGMSGAYFGGQMRDWHRDLYLINALRRLDYWIQQTGNSFPVAALAGPNVGNPFGLMVDGMLIRSQAEYDHYCAHRIGTFLRSNSDTVVEIGGGYCGMAYYLLRDRPGVKYIDFDVPETIALAAYFLIKSFPRLRFLLYGERKITPEALSDADVILLPLSSLRDIPCAIARLAFSSHAMSDLSRAAMREYLAQISRIAEDNFLFIGSASSHSTLSALAQSAGVPFEPVEMRESGWNRHKVRSEEEVECIYHVFRARDCA